MKITYFKTMINIFKSRRKDPDDPGDPKINKSGKLFLYHRYKVKLCSSVTDLNLDPDH